MKHPSLLLLGLALPLAAGAEDVVVTASRYSEPVTDTLAAVTVLTREDIQRHGDTDLSALLGRLAGITTKPDGSLGATSGIFVRGASTSQTVILIDGVRAGSATTGSATLNAIPLSSIERIEVVRGPASSLYGADGIGGVIQIFTRDPEATEDDAYVAAEYGSFNLQQYRAGFRASAGDTTASGQVGYLTTEGFDSTTLDDNGNQDKDGFKQWSGNINVETRLTEDLTLGVDHSQANNDAEYDDAFCTSDCADAYRTKTELMNSGASLTYAPGDNWTVQSRLGRHEDVSISESGSTRSELTTERYTYSLSTRNTWNNGFSTVLGTDGQYDQVDVSADFEETERTNLALFGQGRFNYAGYSVSTSLRVDENSAYGTNATGNVALSSFITGNIETIISYGTAFRAPTFNELYYPGYDNPDLEPEESRTLELALRQYLTNGEWRLSVFNTEVDDLIQSSAPNYIPQNVAEATLQGVELYYQQQLGTLDLQLELSALEALDGDDERLEDRPEVSGSATLGRRFGDFRLDADLTGEQGRVSNDRDLDGFLVLGLGSRYFLGERSFLSARVDNVLDTDYTRNTVSATEDYNTAGRTFKVGIEYHL